MADKKKKESEVEKELAEVKSQLERVSVAYQQLLQANASLTMLTQKYEETINLLTARLLEARAQGSLGEGAQDKYRTEGKKMKLTIVNETGHTELEVTTVEVLDQINDHPTHWVFIDGELTSRQEISNINWDSIEEVELTPAVVGGC